MILDDRYSIERNMPRIKRSARGSFIPANFNKLNFCNGKNVERSRQTAELKPNTLECFH